MEELLRKIGINATPTQTDEGYTIDIADSDEYARFYSRLDKSDELEEDEENSQVTLENSSIQYMSNDDKYTLTLLADFDGDIYKLNIREN